MKWKIAVPLLLLVLGGAAYYLVAVRHVPFRRFSFGASAPAPEAAADLSAKAARRTVVHEVDLAGDVTPLFQVDVKAEISYRIKQGGIHVVIGQQVKQNDVLVDLDDSDIRTNLDVADRDVAAARLDLDKAKRDFKRSKELFAQNLVSQETYDDAQTALDTAQNAYDKAQGSRQQVNDQLSKATIRSPMNGVVLTMPVVEGQMVIGAASVNSGTTLMTIADLSKMIINAQVNQVDIAYIKKGQAATFTVESIKDVKMDGSVDLISPVAAVVNNLKGFLVRILIANPNPNLRPGMTADVVVPVESVKDAVTVPLAAIFTDDDGSSVVYLPGAGENAPPRKQPVKLGIVNYDYAQIVSGVKDGDTVLLSRPRGPRGS